MFTCVCYLCVVFVFIMVGLGRCAQTAACGSVSVSTAVLDFAVCVVQFKSQSQLTEE